MQNKIFNNPFYTSYGILFKVSISGPYISIKLHVVKNTYAL